VAELVEEGLDVIVREEGRLLSARLREVAHGRRHRRHPRAVSAAVAALQTETRRVAVLALARVEVEVEVANEGALGGIGDLEGGHVLKGDWGG
tara:strand:- start:9 stop:287 length:279 start_codon:yes stop_codon:yes gene_type:complete